MLEGRNSLQGGPYAIVAGKVELKFGMQLTCRSAPLGECISVPRHTSER
jgi:hypothetical protein